MTTTNIKTMKELVDTTAAPTGNNLQTFYPKTHEKAVVDNNGNTLDSKLVAIIEDAEGAATAAANVVKAQCEEIKAQTEAIKTQTEAVLDNGAIRTDVAQSLTAEEKTQALANLGISGIDNEPTAGSDNLVRSGGAINAINDAIEKLDIVPERKDTLYVTDDNGNVIAQIDSNGLSVIDVKVKEDNELVSLLIKINNEIQRAHDAEAGKVSAISSNTTVLADASDVFYISDSNKNIIAKIDSNGLKSFDFIDKEGNSLPTKLNAVKSFIEAHFEGEYESELNICDTNNNIIAKISSGGVKSVGFQTPSTSIEDNGSGDFVIIDKNGNIAFKISTDYRCSDIIGDYIKSKYAIAQVSWIDDDFLITQYSSIYSYVHDWCVENGIYLDFAYIPESYSDTVDTGAKMQLLKQWENEGFRFLMHPIHAGWFNRQSEGIVHDIKLVQQGIVKIQRFFKINNIISDGKILVWPGTSNTFADNVDVCSKYVDCGITATNNETNHLVENGRYQLKRYAIQFSAEKTKTMVMNEVKNFIDNGDWVILSTHLYKYTLNDVHDETSNTIANVLDVVEYINSLCPLRPTEDIWNSRRIMYDYFNK